MNHQESSTNQSKLAISCTDVLDAARRIEEQVVRTPVISNAQIDDLLGAKVFFKCENFQHVGAFKARGACNAVALLSDHEAANGVVTHSSGNHAAALARAASLRDIPAHIVMPHNSAAVKIAAVRRYGIEPIWSEPTAESRQLTADRVMQETGATFIHPYNNPAVMAGQGTVALEMFQQVHDLDDLIAPVGGGGLLSGCLTVAAEQRPDLCVYAAEPEWADDAFRSLKSGKLERPTRYDSVADGLRTPLGDLTFPIIQRYVTEILIASENAIKGATGTLLMLSKLLAEPSGATAFATLLSNRERFQGRRVGVIISGGNATAELIQDILGSTEQFNCFE